MPISLVLDIIISGLLVLTIAYAVRLNQRLSQLRSDKNELLQLAKTFAEATNRAENSIQHLKVSSAALQAEVKKAAALKEDLSYLVERGGRSADEMVAKVRGAGPSTGPADGGQNKTKRAGAGRPADPEAQLIEEAIRAATTSREAEPSRPSAHEDRTHEDRIREGRAAVTRRIAGNAKASPGILPSRGFDRDSSAHEAGLALGQLDADGDIENTQSARELLKALGAVK